jgi:hypothetical protein
MSQVDLKSYVPWKLRPTRILHTLITPVARAALLVGQLLTRIRPRANGVEQLDAVLVINLASRPDRLLSFESEMDRLRMRARRFEAISDPAGIIGCTASHAACLQMMLDEGWECVMICEDDAMFKISRRELDVLTQAFLRDSTAEVACFAFHLMSVPVPRNLLFFRARDTRTTACYLIKRSIAPELFALLNHAVDELRRGGDRAVFGVDVIWKRLQRSHVFVVPTVRAVVQAPGFSDIENMDVRYGV